MKKTVRRRYNKDGSITKTTTYRRKNIFGTTVSDSYSERIHPKRRQSEQEKPEIISSTTFFTCLGIFLIAVGLIITVAMIKEGASKMLIIPIPIICIGLFMLPIDIHSLFHRNETLTPSEVIKTENGWICPDCETENSNTSSTCKGCGRYK